MLSLREYQERSLDALAAYLRAATTEGADVPFYRATGRPYIAVSALPGMPYVCLRVPTGGGKTFMACHAVGIAAREYVRAESVVCLWLAPSSAIVKQTLDALRDRRHPYRQEVDRAFSGNVEVMSLADALSVPRSRMDGAACVIVGTLQSLRVDDTEGRKVYESAGALQHHFSGLPAELSGELDREGEGAVVYSLANVLRLRRPVVVMDEAHNARTELSFDTLARLRPACILEFTATPETRHQPERGHFASNVLHHVSALELKAADMVKLPIRLRTRGDWRDVIGDAIAKQRELEAHAQEERNDTGEHIRPIVLFQAQPVSDKELNVEALKKRLIEDFKVPEEEIAVATGTTRETRDVDLFADDCLIRFIITVRALAEGWDCSFAYVLCTLSSVATARGVEQVLGRVLRLPGARRKNRPELNCAYAFAASDDFMKTARGLTDALVEGAGFQKLEAKDLVIADERESQALFDEGPMFAEASEPVSETPNLTGLPAGLRSRVSYEPSTSVLTVRRPLTRRDEAELRGCFTKPEDHEAVHRIARKTRGEGPIREPIRVPLLAIRSEGGTLEMFEESHLLDAPWNLATCDSTLGEALFPTVERAGVEGEIDITSAGRMEMIGYPARLHAHHSRLFGEPGWTDVELANWLDRNIPHADVPRAHSSLFILNVLSGLIKNRGITVEQLARRKYPLARAIEERIAEHRREQRKRAYAVLLLPDAAAPLETSAELCLTIDGTRYDPGWCYDGPWRFRKHLIPVVGELKGEGEEYECAVFLDHELTGVDTWIRNLESRPQTSFWLQTSTDRFYPDFVVRLTDGRVLVVEYKGEDRWSNDDSQEKRKVGDLWAARSGGKCLFVMPKGKDFGAIERAIRPL
ncbi:MAG: DEAD/DEAH box helicase family protein [Planctomycetes bacterium]|nr:DEAD/DEAH box helicase family protein [Planctomycetota bacterium]